MILYKYTFIITEYWIHLQGISSPFHQLTCLLASKFPDKIGGAVFLAPALNFHTRYERMLLSQLPPGARQRYEEGGTVKLFIPDIGEIPVRQSQIRGMGKFAVPLEEEDGVPLNCPVRIIFGMRVSWSRMIFYYYYYL